MWLTIHLILSLIPGATAVTVDTFVPAGAVMDGGGGLQVGGVDIGGRGDGYVGAWLVYTRRPVVETWPDGDQAPVVSDLFATWLSGGMTVAGLMRLGAGLPLYPYVSAPGVPYAGGSVGDLRLSATAPIWRSDVVALAVAPGLSVPTGRANALTSTGRLGGGAVGIVEVTPGGLVAGRGRLGAEARPVGELGGVALGSVLLGGLGVGVRPESGVEVGAELTGALDLVGYTATASPVELHVYGSVVPRSGLSLVLGAGTGLLAGVGAPEVRVLLGVGYHDAGPAGE